MTRMQRLRTCASWRPDVIGYRDPATSAKIALKALARRILMLNDEIADLDRLIEPLVEELASALLALPCVGVESAGEFLVTAGDNPARLRSEASFAMLCGASPIPASSGKTEVAPAMPSYSTNAKGNFQFDRVIGGWRDRPVLDLRLKK